MVEVGLLVMFDCLKVQKKPDPLWRKKTTFTDKNKTCFSVNKCVFLININRPITVHESANLSNP